MQAVTDAQMQQMLAQTKEYTLVLLKFNAEYNKEVDRQLIWEHGRRNFGLRAEGLLNIVAPVTVENNLAGVCIFSTDAAKAEAIMAEDPAVREGVFVYEILPVRSFPGDALA